MRLLDTFESSFDVIILMCLMNACVLHERGDSQHLSICGLIEMLTILFSMAGKSMMSLLFRSFRVRIVCS